MIFRPVILLAYLLCAGCALPPARQTGVPAGGGIAVYGDTQSNTVHRAIVGALVRARPVAVFHTGDLTDDGTSAREWEAFNAVTGKLRSTVPLYPAQGNHENHARRYFDNFKLPNNGRWYRVKVQGTYFFVLDSESPLDPLSGQYRWLEDELAGSGDARKIAVLHRPLFPSAGDERADDLRRWLVPLFERYGVSAVFSGHHHNYERSRVNGIYYIVTGGGGGSLETSREPNPYRQVFHRRYHFCLIQPDAERLNVVVYGLDLRVLDRFEVR